MRAVSRLYSSLRVTSPSRLASAAISPPGAAENPPEAEKRTPRPWASEPEKQLRRAVPPFTVQLVT